MASSKTALHHRTPEEEVCFACAWTTGDEHHGVLERIADQLLAYTALFHSISRNTG